MGLTWACVLLCVFPACGSNLCQNDGTCRLISSTGQEVCSCRHGYSGPHCSVGEWGVVMRCVCVRDACRWGHERAAKVALSCFQILSSVWERFHWRLVPAWFQSRGRRSVICFVVFSSEPFVIVVFGGWVSRGVCACRSGLGVLQRQGRWLQRGGEHHGLGRAVSAVELGPAVRRAPRGHRGRLAPQRPRGSRLLQVRPRLTSHPASADVATTGTWS